MENFKKKCKLCGEYFEQLHQRSHILPKFMSNDISEDPNEIKKVYKKEIKGKIKRMTDRASGGLYEEYILCINCEEILSNLDNYASKVLYAKNGGFNGKISHDFVENPLRSEIKSYKRVYDLDYNKFKLFTLSLFWRFSISNLDFFKNVSFGDKHNEKLSKMIFTGNAKSNEDYPFFILSCINTLHFESNFILTPYSNIIENGLRIWNFYCGGLIFVCFVNSEQHKIPSKYFNLIFKKDEPFFIPILHRKIADEIIKNKWSSLYY